MGGGTSGMTGWVVSVIETIGALGVGVLIALENLFPPIPSEVVLPFAGFAAARGDVSLVLAWIAATLGALVGAYVLYAVGALVGYERLHELAGKRWFLLFSRDDLERGHRFFDDHGGKVVFFARFVPLLRSIVSVPAGMVRMPLMTFTLLTAVGSGIWNALFLYLGYQLGERWAVVKEWVGPVGYVVVGLVLVALGLLVARQVKQRV